MQKELEAKTTEVADLSAKIDRMHPLCTQEQLQEAIFQKASSIRQHPQYTSIAVFQSLAGIFPEIKKALEENVVVESKF